MVIYTHTVEVAGSNPVPPTTEIARTTNVFNMRPSVVLTHRGPHVFESFHFRVVFPACRDDSLQFLHLQPAISMVPPLPPFSNRSMREIAKLEYLSITDSLRDRARTAALDKWPLGRKARR
jgi:hypothetical protein